MVVQLLSTSGGFTRRCSITSQGLACHDIYSEVITEFNSPIRRKKCLLYQGDVFERVQ